MQVKKAEIQKLFEKLKLDVRSTKHLYGWCGGRKLLLLKRRKAPLRRVNFGNILEKPLSEIWYQKECRQFIRYFPKGRMESSCAKSLKRSIDDCA
jgi:hypothetical protein